MKPKAVPGQRNPEIPVRSVRVDDELWGRFKARAAEDEMTASDVLLRFVEDYADRTLNLPSMVAIYDDAHKIASIRFPEEGA